MKRSVTGRLKKFELFVKIHGARKWKARSHGCESVPGTSCLAALGVDRRGARPHTERNLGLIERREDFVQWYNCPTQAKSGLSGPPVDPLGFFSTGAGLRGGALSICDGPRATVRDTGGRSLR